MGNVATDGDDKPLQPIRIHQASAHRGPPPASSLLEQQQQQVDGGDNNQADTHSHVPQLTAS